MPNTARPLSHVSRNLPHQGYRHFHELGIHLTRLQYSCGGRAAAHHLRPRSKKAYDVEPIPRHAPSIHHARVLSASERRRESGKVIKSHCVRVFCNFVDHQRHSFIFLLLDARHPPIQLCVPPDHRHRQLSFLFRITIRRIFLTSTTWSFALNHDPAALPPASFECDGSPGHT
jgi:hypothetical protein